MKKIILMGCMVAMLVSCNDNKPWEYKVVKVAGKEDVWQPAYGTMVFADQTPMLNKMGKEGWELVSTYTEVGTAFPKFVNSKYVIGIRDNHRTCVVNFVFKRHSDDKDETAKKEKK